MIELYKLHWSHYVEKVMWALDYKEIPWRGIDIDAFSKKEMRHLNARYWLNEKVKSYTVPTIHDCEFNKTVADSTSILDYLDTQYPKTRPLIHEQHKPQIKKWLLWLDSELGTLARRTAYSQVILERPALLSRLFLNQTLGGILVKPVISSVSGVVLSSMLAQRFRILQNREDRVYEQAFQVLGSLAEHMKERSFVIGNEFSAADITLATLLRPLRIVPLFRNHQAFQELFEWQTELFKHHNRAQAYIYETELHNIRKKRGWSLGKRTWLHDSDLSVTDFGREFPPQIEGKAWNDHQSLDEKKLLLAPLDYLKLRYFSGVRKVEYANNN